MDWYRSRPVVGGALTVLSGAAIFLSTQLDLANMVVHVGIEGFQATLIPIVLALAGVLAVLMPAQRIFYGVIALAAAVYSLVGVNLGGFFVGFLLGAVGGVMIVSWMPRREAADVADVSPATDVSDVSADAEHDRSVPA
ncbi:hypothetical protein ET445_09005 [Agromyces protaetiae]|uniref:Uncharacterized protein n=1 Tax=Agromyces protaetiae TaxID=2509455 RepID=A0A4P6FCD9_9MICO|nr:DUF6114 domain-containing protein [Agromyces protaetiae]QAY73455.1 hypothetical protein ET445_09005 [Agromyces protaetiae]